MENEYDEHVTSSRRHQSKVEPFDKKRETYSGSGRRNKMERIKDFASLSLFGLLAIITISFLLYDASISEDPDDYFRSSIASLGTIGLKQQDGTFVPSFTRSVKRGIKPRNCEFKYLRGLGGPGGHINLKVLRQRRMRKGVRKLCQMVPIVILMICYYVIVCLTIITRAAKLKRRLPKKSNKTNPKIVEYRLREAKPRGRKREPPPFFLVVAFKGMICLFFSRT